MNQVPNPLIPCIFIYSISSITGRNKNPHAFILYTYITPTTFHQLGGLLWTFHPTTIFLPPTQATHTRGHHRGEFVQFLQGTHLKRSSRWGRPSSQEPPGETWWVNNGLINRPPPKNLRIEVIKFPPKKICELPRHPGFLDGFLGINVPQVWGEINHLPWWTT